jgi:hypothetical protein
MKPHHLRRTLGITAILLIILISYRKMANGNSSSDTTKGRLFTVTAAVQHPSKNPASPILVKGLLRTHQADKKAFLTDEDSVSTNPVLLYCQFTDDMKKYIGELEDDTELVIEGWPAQSPLKSELSNCSIISINKGTVYPDYTTGQ